MQNPRPVLILLLLIVAAAAIAAGFAIILGFWPAAFAVTVIVALVWGLSRKSGRGSVR